MKNVLITSAIDAHLTFRIGTDGLRDLAAGGVS